MSKNRNIFNIKKSMTSTRNSKCGRKTPRWKRQRMQNQTNKTITRTDRSNVDYNTTGCRGWPGVTATLAPGTTGTEKVIWATEKGNKIRKS